MSENPLTPQNRPATVARRTLLTGALAGAGAVALGGTAAAAPNHRPAAPGLVRSRITLPSGIQSGEVTTNSAVVWARASEAGRMIVRIPTHGGRRTREIKGPVASADNDFTAKVQLDGLDDGVDYAYTVEFENADGHRGECLTGHFNTADRHRENTSFVWTGDTAGQGWGINPDLGGMVAYRTMAETKPDFFIHSGDNVYSDSPIEAEVVEPDGQIWRNLVTDEVSKVAETLKEFRGRYRYNQMDENIRKMYADVPVFAQWDDHEITNNWYPGEILEDPRYAVENRVDVLHARGRKAFVENMPFLDGKLYRTIDRGRMLKVFMLDMRSYKGDNTPGMETERVPFLGARQVEWLLRELERSRSTWNVIAADMPIGLIVPDGEVNIEAIANKDPGKPLGREIEMAYLLSEIKRRKIRNVVWLTADVHYCAEHFYDPNKAAFSDFEPFYEFVTGPISAGGFGPNNLNATFGPQLNFQALPAYTNQSPRDQKAMFFGHVDVDRGGAMTVSLRNGLGDILHTRTLEPGRR